MTLNAILKLYSEDIAPMSLCLHCLLVLIEKKNSCGAHFCSSVHLFFPLLGFLKSRFIGVTLVHKIICVKNIILQYVICIFYCVPTLQSKIFFHHHIFDTLCPLPPSDYDFVFFIHLHNLIMVCHDVVSFKFLCLRFVELLEAVGLLFPSNLKNFWPLFF